MAYDYRYGAPPTQQYAQAGRPRCWSNEQYYNPNARECRACTHAMSCRDEIVRLRNYQQPIVAPPAYGYQIPPPPPVGTAVPVHIAPPGQPQPQPLARPAVQPAGSMFPIPAPYQYGWLTDPLYYTLAASPPPAIPQLPGESYMLRMGKNMAKSALMAVIEEAYLALRQWVWAPPAAPAGTAVVDVSSQPPR